MGNFSCDRRRARKARRSMALGCVTIALFLSIMPMPAKAAQFSGSYLLHVCGVDEKGKELAIGGHIACQAYIAGILDYHNLLRSLGAPPSIDFCVAEEVTLETLHVQVYSYLFKHKQEHGAFTAAPAVAMALYQYYPCKKAKGKK